jgi:hypothetical protein
VALYSHFKGRPLSNWMESRLGNIPQDGRRFRTVRDSNDELISLERGQFEALKAIGYVQGSTPATGEKLVTIHKPERVCAGLNLVTDGHKPEAVLMDMDGNVLHTWHYDFYVAFPGSAVPPSTDGTNYWRRVRLLENGDLLAIYEGQGLIKIDRSSKLIWAYPELAHHDLDVGEDGSIYVLTRQAKIIPRINDTEPILLDFVVALDSNGEEKKKVSLLEAFEDTVYFPLIELSKKSGDIFHTNTLEVLDGKQKEGLSAFQAGNVLVSFPYLNTIAVLDMDSEKIVWALSGFWISQHQPTLLDTGNILVLDNQGDSGKSRVVELDPLIQEVVWSYEGSKFDFFTKTCGSNQRLVNGNTLITESDFGRAFEVTPEHEIVWEYYTPNRTGVNNELIATLFEVIRMDPEEPLDWLE